MIQFSVWGANLLLVAQGRALNGMGALIRDRLLFVLRAYTNVHLTVVQYFNKKQQVTM